jgi:hypothetical protein
MNLLLTLLSCLVLAANLRSAPAIEWQHAHPHPTARWLSAVTWGPAGFVAVGQDGEALFSPDGEEWTRSTIPGVGNSWLRAACHHAGKYIAAGTGNLIVLSTNGQDWTVVHPSGVGVANACAAADGMFAVVGHGNGLLVSTNGTDWEERATPTTFADIAFGNGLWVAASGGSAVYTSSNLVEWTKVQTGFPGAGYLPQITFGNGLFVVGGAFRPDGQTFYGTIVRVSTNATDWTEITGLNSFGEVRDVTYGDGRFVAILKRGSVWSTNGLFWEHAAAPDLYSDHEAIAVSDSGRFVAVGTGGGIVRSDDGSTWQLVSQDAPLAFFSALGAANGRFVAVGSYPSGFFGESQNVAVLSSTNGVDWAPVLFGPSGTLTGVAYGNRRWLAAGYGGGVFVSRDGVAWSDCSSPVTLRHFTGLVFGRGRFVAFDANREAGYYSARGKRWHEFRMPFRSDMGQAKYLHGRFIAAGGDQDGTILLSHNGIRWRKKTLPGTGWLAGVAYGAGHYVAAGLNVSAVSRHGVSWSVHPIPRTVYDLEYVNGWFVGVGPNGMMFSRDGVEWEVPSHEESPRRLFGLTTDGETLVGAQDATLYRGLFTDGAEAKP